jgi:hypothetical protein
MARLGGGVGGVVKRANDHTVRLEAGEGSFRFEHVFSSKSSASAVSEYLSQPHVDALLDGMSGCVLGVGAGAVQVLASVCGGSGSGGNGGNGGNPGLFLHVMMSVVTAVQERSFELKGFTEVQVAGTRLDASGRLFDALQGGVERGCRCSLSAACCFVACFCCSCCSAQLLACCLCFLKLRDLNSYIFMFAVAAEGPSVERPVFLSLPDADAAAYFAAAAAEAGGRLTSGDTL